MWTTAENEPIRENEGRVKKKKSSPGKGSLQALSRQSLDLCPKGKESRGGPQRYSRRRIIRFRDSGRLFKAHGRASGARAAGANGGRKTTSLLPWSEQEDWRAMVSNKEPRSPRGNQDDKSSIQQILKVGVGGGWGGGLQTG